MKIQLGAVWHFSLAVRDPEKSAQFWTKNFDLQEMFRSDEAIALTNDAMIIGFFKGTPHPDTIDHLSFHLDSMRALREALETLKKNGENWKIRATRSAPHRRARRIWAYGFTIRTGIAGSSRFRTVPASANRAVRQMFPFRLSPGVKPPPRQPSFAQADPHQIAEPAQAADQSSL